MYYISLFLISVSMTPDNAKIHNEDPNVPKLSEVYGALVMKVIPGSPADLSGIRKNDIITQVNGNTKYSLHNFDKFVYCLIYI